MLGAFVSHRVPSLVRTGMLALRSGLAEALAKLTRLLALIRAPGLRELPLSAVERRRAVAFAESLTVTLNLPES